MPELTKTRLTKERKARQPLPKGKGVPWRVSAKQEIEKYTEIGAMVRAGRFKAGLTQRELAKKLDILPHHVSEMEHGKRPVSKKMAQKLGKLFDLDYRIFL
jgi:ribosome-binding protein aMBF1 (putative translation factor)